MPHFSSIAFKKIPSCRHVEEKIFHRNAGSVRKCNGFLLFYKTVFYFDGSAALVSGSFCFEFHLRDGSNGGQCFASETHGPYAEEVLNIPDFGSSVPLKSHAGIGYAHAPAIVNHLYERF